MVKKEKTENSYCTRVGIFELEMPYDTVVFTSVGDFCYTNDSMKGRIMADCIKIGGR